jgi:hypothetical protein
MALYRAKRAGQHPDGTAKFVREGEQFEWAGKPGAWMELVEKAAEAPSPAPAEADHKEEIAVALNEAPLAEAEPESAPVAETKARKRKGAE